MSFAGQAAPARAGTLTGPTLVAPAQGATGVAASATLSVGVSHESSTDVDVAFYGRQKGGGTGEPFTLVVLPDTQNYSDSATNITRFQTQSTWILAQREARNIAAVIGVGDITSTNTATNWDRAMSALTPLERTDLPLALVPGNHDYATVQGDTGGGAASDLFDVNLPVAPHTKSLQRFDWAGGYMGDPNDAVTIDQTQGFPDRLWKNNYVLFSAGGMDFVIVAAEFNFAPAETIQWIDAVLTHYADRRAILTTHQWLEDDAAATISNQGPAGGAAAAWNTLKDNCNLFLVTSGHNWSGTGERARTEQSTCGTDVSMLLSDYQGRDNGGDGWLRILTFDPAADSYQVETFSPSLDRYERDADSEFTRAYAMDSAPAAWQAIGTTTVAGGTGTASITWAGLDGATEYEWYAEATHDGGTSGNHDAPWSFTTQAVAPATPTGLATAVTGPTSVSASWNPVAGATSYDLAVNGGTGAPLTGVTSPYSVTGLTTGTEACVQVRAVNEGGPSAWSTPVCATPQHQPEWVAYIDTRNASGSGTAANALALTTLPASSVVTPLKHFSDGSAISGVGVAFTATGSLTGTTNGANAAAGTDVDKEFGGIVDLSGVYNMDSGEALTMTFTGLDPGRTYALTATTNRGDDSYTTRTTTYALQGADAFTNASSVGTTANAAGDEVTFVTGANTANGYVARWDGIDPGADGTVLLSSSYGTSANTSYSMGAVKLALEADPTALPSVPTGLTAAITSTTSLTAAWNAVTSATSYELAVDGDTGTPVPVTGTSRLFTGLATGDEVCFQVRAVNANGPSAWSAPACATPQADPGWTAYVDTYGYNGGNHANVLTMASATESGALKRFSDGSSITGAQVTSASSGTVNTGDNGANAAAGTDAATEFGGIVNLAGMRALASGASTTQTFTGLDPARTYTLVATANRDGGSSYDSRMSTFALQDVDTFTNASTAGTTANASGNEVTFSTGNNTALGYVARWTGIAPGADGDLVLTSRFSAGSAAYGAGALKLVQEALAAPDTTPPVITLTGATQITLHLGDTWTDPGASATDTIDGNLTNAIVVGGTVLTTTIGDYTLTYDVTDHAGNHATRITRTVHVIAAPDTTPPVITLTGATQITLHVGDTWTDPGATATDTIDGNLTNAVVVGGTVVTTTIGDYTLTYDVTDHAGNHATRITRTVHVIAAPDTTPPVITLTGATQITLHVGDTWTDPGASATDTIDGNLTNAIVVGGTVLTTTIGDYTLTYDVTDHAGNHATRITRTVHVIAAPQLAQSGVVTQTPRRLVDWASVTPYAPRCTQVSGMAGVPLDAVGVVLNVAADHPTGPGYVLIYPDATGNGATSPPVGSTVNFEPGAAVSNAAFVQLPADGKVCAYTEGASTVRLVLDVTGYVMADAGITTQASRRLLDTRPEPYRTGSLTGPLAPRTVYTVQVTGHAGVPAGATAVLLSVAVVTPSTVGHLRVFPGGQQVPNTATVNYAPGQTKANATVMSLSASGAVSLYSDAAGPVEVVLDVVGWIQGAEAFTAVTPTRVIDSRPASKIGPLTGPLAGRTVYSVNLSGVSGIPADATGVVLNVTAVGPTSVGHLRVYPDVDGKGATLPPNTASVNYIPGRDIPNLVVVALPSDGRVNFWSESPGSVNLVADLVGYLTDPSATP